MNLVDSYSHLIQIYIDYFLSISKSILISNFIYIHLIPIFFIPSIKLFHHMSLNFFEAHDDSI
jgi:hypothetical protein